MAKRILWAPAATWLLTGLALAALCNADDEKESLFVAFGKVTDNAGQPLEGVEVRASCGMGTLFTTGSAKTDAQGQYRLAFRPGILVGNTKLGVGTQVATITPHKKGWYEIHLGRGGDLLMSDSQEQPNPEDLSGYRGVVKAGEPYELNFTMAHAGSIDGRLVTEFGSPVKGVEIYLTGEILPPSSSALAKATTDDKGRFTFESIPVWLADPSIKLKWRFSIRPFGVRHELESTPFAVTADTPSQQTLTLNSTGNQATVHLSLKRQEEGKR